MAGICVGENSAWCKNLSTLQYEGQVEEEESSKQLSSEQKSQRIRDESPYREVGENVRKHVVTSV